MKEFNAEENQFETASAFGSISQERTIGDYPAYMGLDVHEDTIAIAVAYDGREVPESRGEIANRPKTVTKLVERLNQEFEGEVLLFCYEAGPCGYGLYR